ncbi:helicase-associated domain-containing protein [Occultella gossypii]|uniref:Helicase-associated domain-containing protein n=1 Tax=Occultella gossypii TaxID=2800820 RepID=A0ABS7SCP1_9MICO|nr:helicase-associated domain-containing protein [Occultella gossypii]MBZ2197832.1 helicase-associated domain-containing protein [Occultella gossypii]
MEPGDALLEWLGGLGQEEVDDLVARRPDVTLTSKPRDLGDLARRLMHPYGVVGAFVGLPQPGRDLIEAAMGLGSGLDLDRLAEFLEPAGNDAPTHRRVVQSWWEHARSAALCWGAGRRLYVNPGLYETIGSPLWLGRPASMLAEAVTVPVLQRAMRGWADRAVQVPSRRPEVIAAVCAYLAEPDHVRRIVARAPEPVLAWITGHADSVAHLIRTVPAISFHEAPEEEEFEPSHFDRATYLAGRRALDWLTENGLILSESTYSRSATHIPAEVTRAMLPPTLRAPFRVHPPMPVTTPVDPGQAESAAAASVSDFLAAVMATLESVARTPLTQLKAGGVGARELARLAKAAAVEPTEARMAVELGYRIGLFDVTADGSIGTAPRFEQWRRLEPAERAAELLHQWFHVDVATSVDSDRGRPLPALTRQGPGWLPNPALLLDTLAGLDRDVAVVSAEEVFALAAWGSGEYERPRGDAEVTWAEAHRLGALAHRRLSRIGRALSEHRSEDIPDLLAALTDMLPAIEAHILFGSDLTVVVPGSPAAGVVDLLDAMATREARGAASTWRISADTIRGALDAGHDVDTLLEDLAALSDKPLPQAVTYLLHDVGRRYGHLEVQPAGAVLVSEDEALLAEVAATRSLHALGLRQVAPTVLAAAAPRHEVLAKLRSAGFLPRELDEHGQPAVRLSRSAVTDG